MIRLVPLLIFLGLSAGLALMLLNTGEKTPRATQASTPLPVIRVTSPDAKKTWDAKALTGRVTLLNFYASWCAPCALEMPELVALKKQFPKLHLAGVAWNDDPATLTKWLKQHGNPFDSQWIDANGDATIDLGIKGIPETIIVDGQGKVRYRLSAPLTAELRDGEVGALIAQLLKETSDAR